MKSIAIAGLLIAAVSLTAHSSAAAQQANQQAREHDAIIQAAYDYAFGVAELSRERVERAFAMDKAQLKLVLNKNGKESVFVIPIRDLMEKVWLKLPPSPDHFVDVLDIQVIEGIYATITINNNNEFIDHLSLYKLNGQWKIVDKLAIRHSLATPSAFDPEAIFGPQIGKTIALVPIGSTQSTTGDQ